MIDLYPFSGYVVVVFGLDDSGIACAKTLQSSGATVWAWDDDQAKRTHAETLDLTLTDLSEIDWREPVSMVIEPRIAHAKDDFHPYVSEAKKVNCEIISDVELLARVQRESAYVGVVGHQGRALAADVISYVMKLCGREAETTGLTGQSVLDLYPLELNGAYVLDMPSDKIDITVSITYDVAIWLNFDQKSIIGNNTVIEERKAMSWVFHRQTKPKTAIINIDDPVSLEVYQTLEKAEEQALIAVSTTSLVAGGIGVQDEWLIDDREGTALQVIKLSDVTSSAVPGYYAAAVAAYACAVAIGLQSHAAMACLNSYALPEN